MNYSLDGCDDRYIVVGLLEAVVEILIPSCLASISRLL